MTNIEAAKGFTIIELVAVILLTAILGVSVGSRWFDADTFSTSSAHSQFIAQARLAQRIAMASANANVYFEVTQSGSDWHFTILKDDAGVVSALQDLVVPAKNVAITATVGGTSSTLSTVNSLQVGFTSLGFLETADLGGANADPASGISISISGRALCMSPLGFSHDGGCI